MIPLCCYMLGTAFAIPAVIVTKCLQGRTQNFKGTRQMKTKMKISVLVCSFAALGVLGSGCGSKKTSGVVVVTGSSGGCIGNSCGIITSSGGVPISSGGVPISSGGVPISSGGVPISSGGVPISSGGVPISSGGVPISSGGVPISSGGVPISSGGVPISSGGVPISSGGVPISSGGSPISNGSSNGSSTGVVTSNGSSNGSSNGFSVDAAAGPALVGDCTSVDGCVAAAGNIAVPSSLLGTANAADPFSSAQGGVANSVDTDTKDVDLQRAELQGQNMDSQAQSISGQFGMSFESARQLAQLADKMSTLSASGAVSEEAREEIAHAALAVAGISTDDVNSAVASMIKDGDQKAVAALMDKAAANLGMTSSAGLRDQLLPTLGINF